MHSDAASQGGRMVGHGLQSTMMSVLLSSTFQIQSKYVRYFQSGHRRYLLRAIAALHSACAAKPATAFVVVSRADSTVKTRAVKTRAETVKYSFTHATAYTVDADVSADVQPCSPKGAKVSHSAGAAPYGAPGDCSSSGVAARRPSDTQTAPSASRR